MAHRSELYSRWSQLVRRSGLFRAGERVGIAVSGGADSVLLLEFMKKFSDSAGLVISVVHFNHRLRGKESDDDERFVTDLAQRLGVEFVHGDGDVARRAKEQKKNLEATAREMRYRFFHSLIRVGRLDKIATAHTANDQAETVLMRLLRGTGAQGLAGIYPVLDGVIVRPFLNVTRSEIEQEIARRGLEFRQDSSNLDLRFRRNKIRHELLPQLQRDFNPDIVLALSGLADRAREDEEFLKQQAHERAVPWRARDAGEEKFPVRVMAELPRALAFRVLRQMIQSVRCRLGGITHRHMEFALRLAVEGQSGQRTILPGGFEVKKEFDWLVVARQASPSKMAEYSRVFQCPAEIPLPHLGVCLGFKIVGGEAVQRAYNSECVCIDAANLADELELRNWRPGDQFESVGCRKPQKLKELFRSRKIGVTLRRGWPVLVSRRDIIWVRGMPVAKTYAPGKNTRIVLVVQDSPLDMDHKTQN